MECPRLLPTSLISHVCAPATLHCHWPHDAHGCTPDSEIYAPTSLPPHVSKLLFSHLCYISGSSCFMRSFSSLQSLVVLLLRVSYGSAMMPSGPGNVALWCA